ncbi:MAG: carboxylating nicotinate-nucleotide diphosphorylase [Candidatus Omnitrophica bacterium]|nr:carboxylating nicotinate-nucleotide diphosphorylase [Candidatus Omnitrophota bacterium]
MKITANIRKFLKNALSEDIGKVDITTETLFSDDFLITAHLITRQFCILAGIDLFKEIFLILDKKTCFHKCVSDGARLKAGSTVCVIKGRAKSILTGERVALNMVSHLSGIATYTNEFVMATDGRFKILDTRKTLPGLREFEKYAVRIGGGYNHRMNLSEMVLIKDNHINLWAKHRGTNRSDAIRQLTSRAKKKLKLVVEVEVESFEESMVAMESGADIIMFDNTGISEIKKFLSHCGENRPLIEVSGGIELSDIKKLKEIDIDFVSLGKITHSAPAVDFSLEIL